jgi:hemoglobin
MAEFGHGDASYLAAGQREGLVRLVEAFYGFMDKLPEAARIRAMHDADLALSKEKLAVFLSGWLGGPKEYAAKFGPIQIPRVHAHLAIDEPERDAWLLCMQHAVDQQPWSEAFKAYFMSAIAVPAEKVRAVSRSRRDHESA